MAMLIIDCPVTHKPVPTGISTDKASFEDPTNVLTGNSVSCPHCGQNHVWDKKDARLDSSAAHA
jgi:hypothetical protein